MTKEPNPPRFCRVTFTGVVPVIGERQFIEVGGEIPADGTIIELVNVNAERRSYIVRAHRIRSDSQPTQLAAGARSRLPGLELILADRAFDPNTDPFYNYDHFSEWAQAANVDPLVRAFYAMHPSMINVIAPALLNSHFLKTKSTAELIALFGQNVYLFLEFVEIANKLPTVRGVLQHAATVPDNISEQYALCSQMLAYLREQQQYGSKSETRELAAKAHQLVSQMQPEMLEFFMKSDPHLMTAIGGDGAP